MPRKHRGFPEVGTIKPSFNPVYVGNNSLDIRHHPPSNFEMVFEYRRYKRKKNEYHLTVESLECRQEKGLKEGLLLLSADVEHTHSPIHPQKFNETKWNRFCYCGKAELLRMRHTVCSTLGLTGCPFANRKLAKESHQLSHGAEPFFLIYLCQFELDQGRILNLFVAGVKMFEQVLVN